MSMNRLSELKRRLLIATVAAALLAGVFMLFLQPEFVQMVAEQVWACF
jgi:type II secretory pathway component PulM